MRSKPFSYKRLLFRLALVIALINLALVVTDHTYFYAMLSNTVLKGQLNPGIDEYTAFANREVETAHPIPWPKSTAYNAQKPSAEQLEQMEGYGTVAYLVIQSDSILFENYWDGYDETSYSNSFSMAKSIVSILVGIAIEEGRIKSLDQPISDFLPQLYREGERTITIRHLLTMSSGMNYEESYLNPFAFPARANYGSNLSLLMNRYEPETEPGKIFWYQSGNTQLLQQILRKVTGKSLSEYAAEKLWKPLGANQAALWSLDHEYGDEKAFCCFQSNARDFARLGQLFLRNGQSPQGKQLLPEAYVRESVEPATISSRSGKENNFYGLSWWLVKERDYDLYYARGLQGQYIAVNPATEQVIVRLGHDWQLSRKSRHPEDLFLYLDAARMLHEGGQ